MFIEADNVPRVFPSDLPVALEQLLQDIAVPNRRACEWDTKRAERLLHSQVRHQRAYHAALEQLEFSAKLSDDEQQLIAVIQFALLICHRHAVTITVERDTQVR